MVDKAGFACLICWLLVNSVPFAESMECYSCTNQTALCNCRTIAQCPDDNDVCFSEYTLTSSGKLYTLGCRATQSCPPTSGGTVSVVGRSIESNCTQCCDTNNCNRRLCQDPDPSCTDSTDFDCTTVGSTVNYCSDPRHAKTFCRNFCGLCTLRDGEWTTWSAWSACDVSCSNGTQTRSRTCTNPEPKDCGENCVGNPQETKACAMPLCPVHGGWSSWSPWASCSVTCDIGQARRNRTCSNPLPLRNGDHCFGSGHGERLCFMPGCHDGHWGSWAAWSQCSRTCGDGLRSRARNCDNPAPSLTGRLCAGGATNTEMCNVRHCPVKLSAFTVSGPKILSNHLVKFAYTIYNSGHGYHTSTGIFTCECPGVYFFTANLIKWSDSQVDVIQGYISKNDGALLTIHTDPTGGVTGSGNNEATGSVIVHLNKGDTIKVTTNPSADKLNDNSLFSGYLLQSDD